MGARVFGLCVLASLAWVAAPTSHPITRQDQNLDLPPNRFGQAEPFPRAEGTIRLATFNVLNLFDQVDDPDLSGEFDDAGMKTSIERCRALARMIKAVDADVLALQEVESQDALTWFRDTFLSDAGYDHLASIDVGYYRGIECSVMSRFPILGAKVWLDESLDDVNRPGPGWSDIPADATDLRFQRSPLMVDIQGPGGYLLTVVSLHHKAGGAGYRFQREVEAVRIVELVQKRLEREPDRNIVIMGDFNAAPWDKSFRVYLEAGFIDTLAHRIIPRWQNPEPKEPALYKTHESDRVIDYVLMNSAAHRELVIGSAHVFGAPYFPEYNWKQDPYPPGYASDHHPVIIDMVPKDRQ